MASLRLGVDIGGTFTDLVAQKSDGSLSVLKVATTPENPGDAVVTGLLRLLDDIGADMSEVTEIVHGTTVGSNIILQKAGARTGLLTTKGFRDVLEIGRIRTPVMFDLTWEKPEPLSPRRYRREVGERIGANAEIIHPLDEDDVRDAAAFLQEEGVEAVAVCFLNSFVNDAHERRAREILEREFPRLLVTASFDVLPEIKEYERTSTTVVNAYLLKEMRRYLEELTGRLSDAGLRAPLRVVTSQGGMITASAAADKPVFVVGSGPAGGVIGAARLGTALGKEDTIVFDMGGTTAKASVVESGKPTVTTEYEFREGMSTSSRFLKGGGYMLKVPAIDIAEVGAGGGSIAWIDEGGLLRVGPRSAGADPGPACYGRSNEKPTVTDADVYLGYLNPRGLAGGSLAINPELSETAIRTCVAEPLGISVLEAAQGIRRIANLEMARAIRSVTVERGQDARDMTLMAAGGGGPAHAGEVAEILGIKKVVVTPLSGVFCSLGMLSADVEYSFVRTVLTPLDDLDPGLLHDNARDLRSEANERMMEEGFPADAVIHEYSVDVRYVGQSSEVMLDYGLEMSAQDIRRSFLEAYMRLYDHTTEEPVEICNLRLVARGRHDNVFDFKGLRVDEAPVSGTVGERSAFFPSTEAFAPTAVHQRSCLGTAPVQGPAIIEAYDTTIVVPPGATATADRTGSIVMEIENGAGKVTNEGIDPITLAVIKNALDSIVDEVAYTILRTARSEIVKDVMDYSAALCDVNGEMIAQAKTVALHLGAVPEAMKVVIERYGDDLRPNDAVILNDPYQGGMHLPDIFMFLPIFFEDQLQGFSVVICHHTDVGGRVAGSNASDSTEIFQEGLRIPALKLYEGGVMNPVLSALIETNVRLPDLVLGDLKAQYTSCQVGAREVRKLFGKYGVATARTYFAELLDYAERMTRGEISAWPDGTYGFTDYIDDTGLSEEPLPIQVAITVDGDRLFVDYEGSSPQVDAALNATKSYTNSCSYLSVRSVLEGDIPNNAGVFRCIEVKAPEASILNPVMPAPCAARALTGYRVFDTMLGALSQIVPHRVPAAGEGGNTVVCIGGYRPDKTPFIVVDMICGAWGARPDRDGIEAITNPSQNLSNTPIETMEARQPIRIEEYALIPDSCGAGKWRGGLGVTRSYRLLSDNAILQLRADRIRFKPYGLSGGEPATGCANKIFRDGRWETLPGKITSKIQKGDLVRHEQAGGGGFGDPLERDPDLVAEDVWNEKISLEFALKHHGVDVDGETFEANDPKKG